MIQNFMVLIFMARAKFPTLFSTPICPYFTIQSLFLQLFPLHYYTCALHSTTPVKMATVTCIYPDDHAIIATYSVNSSTKHISRCHQWFYFSRPSLPQPLLQKSLDFTLLSSLDLLSSYVRVFQAIILQNLRIYFTINHFWLMTVILH